MDSTKAAGMGKGGERNSGVIKQVRPTIVAAVGGTGVAAAKYTLKSMAELLGGSDKLNFLAVRAFDTAEQDNEEPRLKDNTEFVQLSSFNVGAVLAAVNEKTEFSHWKEWLPPLLSVQQVSSGVGGLRPKGRLCYCFRRDRVKEAINSALAQIEDAQKAAGHTEEDAPVVNVKDGIDIHIVSSVCGGTGSSMFIDVAYDIRNWAQAYTGGDVTVIGHLVLPGAFAKRPVVESALMANAYAALQELDHFMRTDARTPWKMRYGQFETVESPSAPFNQCYLLDGVCSAGLIDVSHIASIIGDAIAHMTVSDIGQRLKFGIRNIQDQSMVRTDERDRPCCYSSYGLVTIEAKNDQIFRQVLDPLVGDVIDRLTKAGVAEQDIAGKIARLGGEFGVDANQIVEDCTPPPDFPRYLVTEAAESGLEDPIAVLKELIRSAEPEYERKSRAQFAGDIGRFDAIKALVEKDLSESLRSSGLVHCVSYLDRFHSLARERAEAASTVRRKEQAPAAGPDAAGADLDDLIDRALQSIRRTTLRNLLSDKITDLEKIANFASSLHHQWSTFAVAIEESGPPDARFDSGATTSSRGGRHAAAGPKHFEGQLTKEQKARIADDVLAALAPKIAGWRDAGGVGGMKETIHMLTDQYWRQQGLKYDCEADFIGGLKNYGDRLGVLWNSAAPMWEIDPGYALAGERREISAISADHTSKLFQTLSAAQPRLQPSSGQRPDLISIFRTEHGVSLMGLKRLAGYREMFNRIAIHEQRWDFHLFNDRRWISEMMFPDEPDSYLKNYETFSLATMLEIVTRKEAVGYEWPDSKQAAEAAAYKQTGIVGTSRREAFSYFQADGLFERLGQQVQDELNRLAEAEQQRLAMLMSGSEDKAVDNKDEKKKFDRAAAIKHHIEVLNNKVSDAVNKYHKNPSQVSERLLKADVFQIHTEIRALHRFSRETGIGL